MAGGSPAIPASSRATPRRALVVRVTHIVSTVPDKMTATRGGDEQGSRGA